MSTEGMRTISRRSLAKQTIGVAATLLTGGTAVADAQRVDLDTTTLDTRVELIEKSRGKAFTASQKKTIANNLKTNDDAWTKCRAEFRVPDQVEPAFTFAPNTVDGGDNAK